MRMFADAKHKDVVDVAVGLGVGHFFSVVKNVVLISRVAGGCWVGVTTPLQGPKVLATINLLLTLLTQLASTFPPGIMELRLNSFSIFTASTRSSLPP